MRTKREAHLGLGGEVGDEFFFDPAYIVAHLPGGPADLSADDVRDAGLDYVVEHDPERA